MSLVIGIIAGAVGIFGFAARMDYLHRQQEAERRRRERERQEREQRIRDYLDFMHSLRGFGLADDLHDIDIDHVLRMPSAPCHAEEELAA